jgi:hypothetical protein
MNLSQRAFRQGALKINTIVKNEKDNCLIKIRLLLLVSQIIISTNPYHQILQQQLIMMAEPTKV